MPNTRPEDRIAEALAIAERYGMIEGDHHKMWVIDQMLRTLLGDWYEPWRKAFDMAHPNHTPWDEGIAP